jgi:hypothetical protein
MLLFTLLLFSGTLS